MFVQKLGLRKKKTEKRRKLSQDMEESLVLRPSSPTLSPALLSPAVVHDVSANPSIADYPQMARLRGTIKEKSSL